MKRSSFFRPERGSAFSSRMAQVRAITNSFLARYNGNIPLKAVIKHTQEELYGPEFSRANYGYEIQGAYHPASGLFTVATSNLHKPEEVERLLRHELLGHYGLNTFKPAEKNDLLARISQTQEEPSLAHIWDKVKADYGDKPPVVQAEEVFAYVAEEKRSFFSRSWDKVRITFGGVLNKSGLATKKLTHDELRLTALKLAEGIRKGALLQQTFPLSDEIATPGAGQRLELDSQVIALAAKAAAGLASREQMLKGIKPNSDDLIAQSSALLIPNIFQGEQVGWDCQLYEDDTTVEVGSIRVFPNGFVVEAVMHNGNLAWSESTELSIDSPEAREHLNRDLAEGTQAVNTKQLTMADIESLEQRGWKIKMGRKLAHTSDPTAYLDTHPDKPVVRKANNDVINITAYDDHGRPVHAVAWYDKAQDLHNAVKQYTDRMPDALKETAESLYLYVVSGCRDDITGQAEQLALGKELFQFLSDDQQNTLRQQGVTALDDVLVQFTGNHGGHRATALTAKHPAPGL